MNQLSDAFQQEWDYLIHGLVFLILIYLAIGVVVSGYLCIRAVARLDVTKHPDRALRWATTIVLFFILIVDWLPSLIEFQWWKKGK